MELETQVQTADAPQTVDASQIIEELSTVEVESEKHKTGDRVTGTVIKVGGELHLQVDNQSYMLHFTSVEHHDLKVNDQISGQLFVYINPESVKRFGYVQLGSVRKLK
jgi:hypothetical protein